ncbi:MAG: T9SS type A sorting domain-containing protein [Bacteroidetes bacterium]|nr:T9SS type A sorting domain-containing protein [Bacteroidota bacterium]
MKSTTATFLKRPFFQQMLPFLVASVFATAAAGQVTCTYTINMYDGFGDGWQGGELTVVSNGVTSTHTLASGSQGTSTFQVTDGGPITITFNSNFSFTLSSFELLNTDGTIIDSGGDPANFDPIPDGVVYQGIGYCPICPAPNPSQVNTLSITDVSAFINWSNVGAAEYFIVEYGPQGFPLGSGLTVNTTASQIGLFGLNPCVDYDVYIASFCGMDSVSSYVGPFSFQTTYTPSNPGATCTYTFQLYDSFGDGWNGCSLNVTHNGVTTNYTFFSGTQATFTFVATSNLPIEFTFIPGAFLDEVSYEIIDPNGNIIFSDGPFPQLGEVFTTIACPTCPGPLDAWMSDVNATNARIAWQPASGAFGNYIIEYGPMAFTLGTGTADTVPVGQLSYLTLPNLTENTWYNAYIKLDCDTEFSKPIGPLMFKTLWLQDLGVSGITTPDPAVQCDLTDNEIITVQLTNYGQAPQTLFEFYFAVNGQVAPIPVPQDGLFTGVIGNDSTQTISFETTWDFSAPGVYIVEAWTVLPGDSQTANDTFRTEIITAYPKPMKEDFEDSAVNPAWTYEGFIYPPFSHTNPTYVLAENLYAGNQSFQLTTNRVGPVEVGDTLRFDYRYVNWSAGTTATVLGPNDKLELQVSDNCQNSWQTVLTINSANHITSTNMATKFVLLDAYDGEAINVRLRATWGTGDYWLDIDNINITGCPPALTLLGNVHGSLEGDSTGSIDLTVFLAEGPFTFLWTNSAGDTVSTEQDPSGLPVGMYSVQVTDANGCTGFKTFDLGTFVDVDDVDGVEQLLLYPNPTSGTAFLDLKLVKNMDVQLRLLNLNGSVLFESEQSFISNLNQELDLTNQAPGMYILQVVADGKPHYAKLMVAR